MITIQLAEKLYKEHVLITIVRDRRFVDFEDYIEKAPNGGNQIGA